MWRNQHLLTRINTFGMAACSWLFKMTSVVDFAKQNSMVFFFQFSLIPCKSTSPLPFKSVNTLADTKVTSLPHIHLCPQFLIIAGRKSIWHINVVISGNLLSSVQGTSDSRMFGRRVAQCLYQTWKHAKVKDKGHGVTVIESRP